MLLLLLCQSQLAHYFARQVLAPSGEARDIHMQARDRAELQLHLKAAAHPNLLGQDACSMLQTTYQFPTSTHINGDHWA
jgi:hypothetical protein